jgi:hypothetical protein
MKCLDEKMSPPDEIHVKFKDGYPFVEIIENKDRLYCVRFINKSNDFIHLQIELKSNSWTFCTIDDDIDWVIRIYGISHYYYAEYNITKTPPKERMVVIATHNGAPVLKNLLDDIRSFNIPNNEVCIVDNKSTDKLFIEYVSGLKDDGYNVLFNPMASYQPGAYKLAIETFKANVWCLFQDSMRLKQNVFEMIEPKLTNNNIYTFLTFDLPDLVYNPPIYKFLFEHYQTIRYKIGIVSNIIFAKDEVIQKTINDWAIPTCKNDNSAMEIGFGMTFEKYGIEIHGLDVVDEREHEWHKNGKYTKYPFFDKILMYKYRD